jgi:hypothetical protein
LRHRQIGQAVAIVTLLLTTVQPVLADDALLRSLLLPGAGQVNRGNYGRATLFASAAVVTGVGLFISQIHYDRSAERYNDFKRTYLSYKERLASGEVIRYSEITSTYDNMQSNLESAKDRYAWRNTFLVSLIGCYTLNLVDILISGRSPEEQEIGLSIEPAPDGLRIVRSVRF